MITPQDEGYDAARRVWNADIAPRPALIMHCLFARDVAAAVTFPVDHGVEISRFRAARKACRVPRSWTAAWSSI